MSNHVEKNSIEYIAMKDIKQNEDLHKIARAIKLENDNCLMPKNTTRKEFLAEIKSEIEWYLDFVSPPVNKNILSQQYMEILKIEEKERSKSKNMKDYEKTINKRNITQNTFALNILLQNGRNNLLNEQYYQTMIKGVTTTDYLRETMEIARKMAELKDKDFCEYVYEKVKEEKKIERNR